MKFAPAWMTALVLLSGVGLAVSAEPIKNEDCFDCHEAALSIDIPELLKDVEAGDPVPFPTNLFAVSAHADLDCIDCHASIEEADHTEQGKLKPVDCAECHEDEQNAYINSLHHDALKAGHKQAPHCVDCHGPIHEMLAQSATNSPTHHGNIPRTCARCHEDLRIVEERSISMKHPFESYLMTVHGRDLMELGEESKAAVCSDCHAAHNLRKRSDPASLLFKFNIPKTCGSCHEEILKVYSESSHGRALADGILEAPVCTDCHGEHNIMAKDAPGSFTGSRAIGLDTCARCHEDQRLIQRFGLSDEVASFKDSFHGLALRGGSRDSANCASCHGYHNIKASTDPASSTHPDNLPKTCGNCHPGVNQNVVLGKVHLPPMAEQHIVVRIVQWIYIPLIIAIIGGMFLHNLMDFIRKEITYHKKSDQTIVRFSLNQRIQHAIMMVSFFVLVLTGFALKYPDSWWVAPFNRFDWFFAWRSNLHRIAAVVMIAVALYHLGYLVFTREGRRDLRCMLFRRKDIRDMLTNFRHFIGRGTHPKFARFSYMEKAEYWALQWGTVIMCVTGLMLWFEGFALSHFPKWVTDVCTLVHLYEAILATLAILVWHLYYVIVNHNVYPLNRAMFTGRVSPDFVELEHPHETSEIKALEQKPPHRSNK